SLDVLLEICFSVRPRTCNRLGEVDCHDDCRMLLYGRMEMETAEHEDREQQKFHHRPVEVPPKAGGKHPWLVFQDGDFFRESEHPPLDERPTLTEFRPPRSGSSSRLPRIMEREPRRKFHRECQERHDRPEQGEG